MKIQNIKYTVHHFKKKLLQLLCFDKNFIDITKSIEFLFEIMLFYLHYSDYTKAQGCLSGC